MPQESNLSGQDREVATKILKLLRKAESTTHEAEADAFRAKASEMMQEHSLSRGEVRSAQYEIVRTLDHLEYKRAPQWYKHLHFSVAGFLGVYHVYHRSTGSVAEWTWAGLPRDIKLARYMVEAIVAQVQRETESWKKQRRSRRAEVEDKVEEVRADLANLEQELSSIRASADAPTRAYDRVREKLRKRYEQLSDLKHEKKTLQTGRKQTKSFRVGMMVRIHERLHAMVDDVSDGRAEKGLVKRREQEKKKQEAKEVYLMFADEEPESIDPAMYGSMEARNSGYERGDDVQVHKGAPAVDNARALPA